MNGYKLISCLSVFIVFLTVEFCYSQTEKYRFRHLTTKQGLPSNLVSCITKDHYGFMWIGTDNGLSRYDGYTFETYPFPLDSVSESSDRTITSIVEDDQFNLWFGTLGCGLLRFDRISETYTHFTFDPDDSTGISHNTVHDIYKDQKGILWIGTGGGGLNVLDPETYLFRDFRQDLFSSGLGKDNITALYSDDNDTLWVGTHAGVFLFDLHKELYIAQQLHYDVNDPQYRRITSIIEDKNGNVWIGSYWGIWKYNMAKKEYEHYLPPGLSPKEYKKPGSLSFISNAFIQTIVESSINYNHELWIATKWGLNKFDFKSECFSTFHHDKENPNSLATSSLKTAFLEDNGLLWIGTRNSGLSLLNIKTSPFFPSFMKVLNDDINYQAASFFIDHESVLWAGGVDGGLFRYDKDVNQTDNFSQWIFGENAFDDKQHNQINCIFEDAERNLWLGFYAWGLVRFDREAGTFNPVELNKLTPSKYPILIENIIQDPSGKLWVGSNRGLFVKNNTTSLSSPAFLVNHAILSEAHIMSLFLDTENRMYISTRRNGLYVLDNIPSPQFEFEKMLTLHDQDGLSMGSMILSICEDPAGLIWMASNMGLFTFSFEERKLLEDTTFNTRLPGKINRVFCDANSNLWIFHDVHGLVRYQPNIKSQHNIKVFDEMDGMPFEIFNTGISPSNAFCQSPDGRLFLSAGLGTDDSFLWFYPDSMSDNNNIPNIVITQMIVGNEPYTADSNIILEKHITLKYDQNFFSFEFSALDFINPEDNSYAYFLDGYENGWNYSGNRRIANYTGVAPGSYTFRVRGSNNDGYWNEEGTFIHISILPPPWKTWWAYIIYGVVALAIIISIVYYYLKRQQLIHNLAIEQFEIEKLKELDGIKTKLFTNISHEFRTPLTLILGPIQQMISKINKHSDKQALSMVLQNALRLKDLVNQLLTLSKLESGKMKLQCAEMNIVDFVRNYVQSFESLASHENIELVFTSSENEIPAYFDKEKMAEVLNNLLSNAFKFTDSGGRIKVAVNSRQSPAGSPQSVEIKISDTGRGIPTEKLKHIFDRFYQADDSMSREKEGTGIGLSIVKEMINLHQGEIEVESIPGQGTIFSLFLPLGNAHLEQAQVESNNDFNPEFLHSRSIQPKIERQKITRTELYSKNSLETDPIILIVEDNPDMRTFIKGYFIDELTILEAEDGRDGLKKAFDTIPDLIISDVMMPGMDGYEFCRKIKSDERSCHIPVILLTARASKESRMEGLGTGADDFITKPFDGEELQVRVNNLLDQRKKLGEYFRKDFKIVKNDHQQKVLSMDEKFLHKAKRIVEKNISNSEYGVDEFASDMALSRYQLHRKLTALVNQPITEFVRTIRLKKAVELLEKRAATISEIAYDTGFSNPNYFSISFKKQFGMSPRNYLDQLDQD